MVAQREHGEEMKYNELLNIFCITKKKSIFAPLILFCNFFIKRNGNFQNNSAGSA